MRLSLILLLLFPTVLFGAGTRARVYVMARVPLVITVEGPAQVVLAAGESTRIPVRVLANVPWVLSIDSAQVGDLEATTLSGQPGGAATNSRDVTISCSSSQSAGRHTITLVYTLMPG